MSEDDKQPPKPPKPMKKTSAVPLKKETVRVTLKATDDAPKPAAPAPTIPLRAANPGAPSASKPAAPAPTVQLKTPGAATAPKTTPLKTQPLATPGAPGGETQALPKATVQLGSATQALGAPTGLQVSTIQTAVEEEDEENSTLTGILSLVAFLIALAVLSLQLMTTAKWVDQEEPVKNGSGWNALFE